MIIYSFQNISQLCVFVTLKAILEGSFAVITLALILNRQSRIRHALVINNSLRTQCLETLWKDALRHETLSSLYRQRQDLQLWRSSRVVEPFQRFLVELRRAHSHRIYCHTHISVKCATHWRGCIAATTQVRSESIEQNPNSRLQFNGYPCERVIHQHTPMKGQGADRQQALHTVKHQHYQQS